MTDADTANNPLNPEPNPNPALGDGAMRTQPVPTCISCGSPGRTLYDGLHDRCFGTPGTWSFRKCSASGCGLVWLDPAPIEEDLWKAYATYYTHGSVCHGAGSMTAVVGRNAIRCLNLLLLPLGLRRKRFLASTVYLAGVQPGRLLDVGCGEGGVLDRARTMGWRVQGVELDPRAAETARNRLGLNVREGTLEQAGFEAESFDAVVLNHVIEHVYDPVTLLRECRRVLKRGGCLVVVTPNVESFGHGWFGADWLSLDPPRHLHLFALTTLHRVGVDAGFSKLELFSTPADAESMSIGSEAIRAQGEYELGSTDHSVQTTLRAFVFQVRALLRWRRQDGSGKEIVMRAVK